ncbi:MAG: hypothetical protein AAF657_35480 [Acidobacteriota bacterium]
MTDARRSVRLSELAGLGGHHLLPMASSVSMVRAHLYLFPNPDCIESKNFNIFPVFFFRPDVIEVFRGVGGFAHRTGRVAVLFSLLCRDIPDALRAKVTFRFPDDRRAISEDYLWDLVNHFLDRLKQAFEPSFEPFHKDGDYLLTPQEVLRLMGGIFTVVTPCEGAVAPPPLRDVRRLRGLARRQVGSVVDLALLCAFANSELCDDRLAIDFGDFDSKTDIKTISTIFHKASPTNPFFYNEVFASCLAIASGYALFGVRPNFRRD